MSERMILISPRFDIDGVVVFEVDPDRSVFPVYQRRISRRPALSGQTTFEDYGGGYSDSTAVIAARFDEENYVRTKRMVSLYGSLLLSCREGLFKGGASEVKSEGENIEVTFLIEERIA